jgi:hypothetical protein
MAKFNSSQKITNVRQPNYIAKGLYYQLLLKWIILVSLNDLKEISTHLDKISIHVLYRHPFSVILFIFEWLL